MKFFIPCLPVAQPRAKATTINGKARMYEAKKSHPIHEFKAAVKSGWHQAGAVKIEGEIVARLQFAFARPPKVPKKHGTGRLTKPTKPDLDNLAKGVCDSLNGLAYADDSQIVELTVLKYRAAEGEVPGVTVELLSASPFEGREALRTLTPSP
jgi:Holliday junction resolvase RusA-like endonuclease